MFSQEQLEQTGVRKQEYVRLLPVKGEKVCSAGVFIVLSFSSYMCTVKIAALNKVKEIFVV